MVVGYQHKTGDIESNSEDHSRRERKSKYTTKVKGKNDNEERNRLEIGKKNTFKKKKLGKESLNEPRKSSRYEMRQTDR